MFIIVINNIPLCIVLIICPKHAFMLIYWGEPERAPHKREVRAVCLSVCLSVRTFMTRKYTRTVLIYGYLQLLIAAFKAGLVHWFVHQRSTNM